MILDFILKLIFGIAAVFLGATSPCFADEPSSDNKVPTPEEVHAARTSGLPLTSNTVADIAQSAAPAVVNIEFNQEVSALGGQGFESPFGNLPFGNFDFFYNGQRVNPNQMPKMETRGNGSGFIVRSDGYILTNAHVVRGAKKIKVTLNDKRVLAGTVIGTDGFSDLAIIKVDAKDLPVVRMGSSSGIRPGEFCIAIGSPLGFDHTVTFGIISAVERTLVDVNGNINFLQVDAAINPGNSGGPLLNLNGEVIGVNTAMKPNAQSMGFSIPVDIAKIVSENLIEHKTIDRPWLGIIMQTVDETIAKSLGALPNTKGVVIRKVLDGSAAHSSGLQSADIIQKIEGKDIDSPKAVQDIVHLHHVGDLLHFAVLRKGLLQAVPVKIGQYPDKPVTLRTEE